MRNIIQFLDEIYEAFFQVIYVKPYKIWLYIGFVVVVIGVTFILSHITRKLVIANLDNFSQATLAFEYLEDFRTIESKLESSSSHLKYLPAHISKTQLFGVYEIQHENEVVLPDPLEARTDLLTIIELLENYGWTTVSLTSIVNVLPSVNDLMNYNGVTVGESTFSTQIQTIENYRTSVQSYIHQLETFIPDNHLITIDALVLVMGFCLLFTVFVVLFVILVIILQIIGFLAWLFF